MLKQKTYFVSVQSIRFFESCESILSLSFSTLLDLNPKHLKYPKDLKDLKHSKDSKDSKTQRLKRLKRLERLKRLKD